MAAAAKAPIEDAEYCTMTFFWEDIAKGRLPHGIVWAPHDEATRTGLVCTKLLKGSEAEDQFVIKPGDWITYVNGIDVRSEHWETIIGKIIPEAIKAENERPRKQDRRVIFKTLQLPPREFRIYAGYDDQPPGLTARETLPGAEVWQINLAKFPPLGPGLCLTCKDASTLVLKLKEYGLLPPDVDRNDLEKRDIIRKRTANVPVDSRDIHRQAATLAAKIWMQNGTRAFINWLTTHSQTDASWVLARQLAYGEVHQEDYALFAEAKLCIKNVAPLARNTMLYRNITMQSEELKPDEPLYVVTNTSYKLSPNLGDGMMQCITEMHGVDRSALAEGTISITMKEPIPTDMTMVEFSQRYLPGQSFSEGGGRLPFNQTRVRPEDLAVLPPHKKGRFGR